MEANVLDGNDAIVMFIEITRSLKNMFLESTLKDFLHLELQYLDLLGGVKVAMRRSTSTCGSRT